MKHKKIASTPLVFKAHKKRFKPAPALVGAVELKAKKSPVASGDHHEAFQKTTA